MKVVHGLKQPQIDVLNGGYVRLVDWMGSDLSIVRSARVSYDADWRPLEEGELVQKDEKLIRYLMANKHTSPFESVTFTFEIKAPIFVFRQHHRHRTWCLSGDSMIRFELPTRIKNGFKCKTDYKLSELYDKWVNGALPIPKKSFLLPSYENDLEDGVNYTIAELAKIVHRSDVSIRELIRSGALLASKTIRKIRGICVYSTTKKEWVKYYNRDVSIRIPMRDRLSAMYLRVYDEKTKEFTTGHIKDVMYSGKKTVYEIVTENDKKLRCSKDHLILTTNGWQTLENAIGLKVVNNRAMITRDCSVLTNGIPVYHDKEWLKKRREMGWNLQQIAQDAGDVATVTIRQWLKRYGLQYSKKEIAQLGVLKNGGPWNKGVRGYSIKKSDDKPFHTPEGLVKIRLSRSGANCNFWKGGVTTERDAIGIWTTSVAHNVHKRNNFKCVDCGSNKNLHAHHILPVVTHPEKARDIDNLTTLCAICHRKHHFQHGEMRMGKGVKLTARPEKIVKIKLLGEIDTYDISVAGENHNFISDGIIVHNSYNEVSARYTELDMGWYVPEIEHITTQSKSNKQMRTDEIHEEARTIQGWINRMCQDSFIQYKKLIEMGCPRELARGILPVNTYSKMFATVNLNNLFKFIDLRSHAHAQYEIRVYSDAMLQLIEPIVPVAVRTYKELQSVTT